MRRSLGLSLLLLAGACITEGSATNDEANGGTSATDPDVSSADADASRPGPSVRTSPGIDHVLVTGQSNSVGLGASPVLSTVQPFANVMFDVGVMTSRACDPDGCLEYTRPTSLVPLVEGDTYFDYPVETIASGLANETAKISGTTRKLLVSIHGRSGNSYACLRKGGCDFYSGKGYVTPFDEALWQVADAQRLSSAQGLDYAVRAVAVIHGETDHYASPFPLQPTDGSTAPIQTYGDALIEWQRDYDAAIRAATKQTFAVPLLVSQMSNWNDRPDSDIPGEQLLAHTRAPGKVVLIGPTYMLPFAADCIHFTSHGERQLGEYFAKASAGVVAGGWEPLRPLGASLSGETITVRFAVPVPPLVLDIDHVADPGNFGFEYTDASSAAPAIGEVRVSGPDTVTIRLAAAPTSGGGHVRYAMRATPFTCPGPITGPRGNLRDSDATASINGYALANWAVHFDVAIP